MGSTVRRAAFALVIFAISVLLLVRSDWLTQCEGTTRRFVEALGWTGSIVSPLLVVVPAIYFWVRMRGSVEKSLDELSDRAAIAVYNLWDYEARARSLLEPEPLPIRWRLSTREVAGPPRTVTGRPGSARCPGWPTSRFRA